MQVTFMTRLIVALIEELQSKGFKIGSTDVSEDEIGVLVFSNDNSDYAVDISTKNGYLKWTGNIRRESRWDTGFQIDPWVKELGSYDDGIHIKITEDDYVVVVLKKYFGAKLSMENIDKNATRAIASNIIDNILNS